MSAKERLKGQFTCPALWWKDLGLRLLYSYVLVHGKSVSEFGRELYWDNARAVHLACWHISANWFCSNAPEELHFGTNLALRCLVGRAGACLWRFKRSELKGSNVAPARPNSSLSESVQLFQEQCKEQMSKRFKLKPQIQMLHNCTDFVLAFIIRREATHWMWALPKWWWRSRFFSPPCSSRISLSE